MRRQEFAGHAADSSQYSRVYTDADKESAVLHPFDIGGSEKSQANKLVQLKLGNKLTPMNF